MVGTVGFEAKENERKRRKYPNSEEMRERAICVHYCFFHSL